MRAVCRARRLRELWIALVVALVSPSPARADERVAPESRTGDYSPFERDAIERAEAWLEGERDPAPEGKIIEAIDVVSYEVFEYGAGESPTVDVGGAVPKKRKLRAPPDPKDAAVVAVHAMTFDGLKHIDRIVDLANSMHTTTRAYVIRRESLMRVGEPYRKVIADETARNLRRLSQVSLVVCVAFKGKDDEHVRFVMITKDVWSLRLNWDLKTGAGGLESLTLQPIETNIAGTQQSVGSTVLVLPESTSVGMGYSVPRVSGRRLALITDAAVIINRERGEPEGSAGIAAIERPLYSTRTNYSWGVAVSWRDEVLRRYVNAQLSTFDTRLTPEPDGIPWAYRGRRFTHTAHFTRSWGWAKKVDLTFGAEINKRVYRTPDLSVYNPVAVREFLDTRVPVSDTRVGPFAQVRAYSNDFLRVLNMETLGLQEDVRLGHDLWLKTYPIADVLGSSRTFLGLFAAAQYTAAIRDGVASVGVESTTEAQPDQIADGSFEGWVRLATPRLGIGRVILDARGISRYRNYLHRNSFIGGDDRLRGYPSNFFVGKDAVAGNVEFRSRPIRILTAQLGFTAFYDAGDAAASLDQLAIKQSVGGGIRFLFPELDRRIFRIDVGTPLTREALPPSAPPVSFFMSFGQAFGFGRVGDVTEAGTSTAVGSLGQ